MLDRARAFLKYYLGPGERNFENINIGNVCLKELILVGCLMVFQGEPDEDSYGLFNRAVHLYYNKLNKRRFVKESIAEIETRKSFQLMDEKGCIAMVIGQTILDMAHVLMDLAQTEEQVVPIAEVLYEEYFT